MNIQKYIFLVILFILLGSTNKVHGSTIIDYDVVVKEDLNIDEIDLEYDKKVSKKNKKAVRKMGLIKEDYLVKDNKKPYVKVIGITTVIIIFVTFTALIFI